MIQRRVRRTPLALTAVTVLAAGLFAGCGGAEVELNPGTAAVVGDQQVSVATVDDTAQTLCTVLGRAGQIEEQGYPMGVLRTAVQRGLALESMAEQVAAEYDVDVSVELEQGTEPVREAYATADPSAVVAVLPAFVGDGYLRLVLQTAAAEEIGAEATQQAVLARAEEIGAEWIERNGLSSNPAFEEIALSGEGAQGQRSEPSVAVSDWARRALAPASPEEAGGLVADLPDSQRCVAGA